MIMNPLERVLMNNPARVAIQRYVALPVLRALEARGAQRPAMARVLEVGCGSGAGVELILDGFGAARVDAFDLDPVMIDVARRKLARRGDAVKLWVGDVTAIDAPDGAYDAVFGFGVLHHVPAWRDGLREIHRVLAPGGRLYLEESFERFISHPFFRRLLDHPQGDRFDHAAFDRGIAGAGFRTVASRNLLETFGWFVADKPAPE